MKTWLPIVGLALCTSSPVLAQRPEPGNSSVIVVTGEGEVRAAPDEAVVRMGILRQARTAEMAQDQANTTAKEILAAIGQAGIPANEIRTSGLRLSPMYEDRGRVSGYQATNLVTVRVIDLNKVGPVIDAGLRGGANDIQGIQFGLRDDLPARQQALKQAATEARKKAETLAEALSVRLGAPIEITESAPMIPRPRDMVYTMEARATAPTPVAAGDLEIHASVTIRYLILPR